MLKQLKLLMQRSTKNKSNMSTAQISGNMSARTGLGFETQKKTAQLSYADIPMNKDLPYWNQSAATWRNTSHRYSFSKSKRFQNAKLNYLDIGEPVLPSTQTKITCTFGKGQKKPISEIVLRNAREKPAPDIYDVGKQQEKSRSKEKGKSFGLPWNHFEKVYLQHRKDSYSSHFSKDNPSAKYQVREKPGKGKRAFSAYGRLKMFTQSMSDSKNGIPGPHYTIKDKHLQNNRGLNERNFSFDERLDLSTPANDFPGSQYYIGSFCDKFKNTKKKNQKA